MLNELGFIPGDLTSRDINTSNVLRKIWDAKFDPFNPNELAEQEASYQNEISDMLIMYADLTKSKKNLNSYKQELQRLIDIRKDITSQLVSNSNSQTAIRIADVDEKIIKKRAEVQDELDDISRTRQSIIADLHTHKVSLLTNNQTAFLQVVMKYIHTDNSPFSIWHYVNPELISSTSNPTVSRKLTNPEIANHKLRDAITNKFSRKENSDDLDKRDYLRIRLLHSYHTALEYLTVASMFKGLPSDAIDILLEPSVFYSEAMDQMFKTFISAGVFNVNGVEYGGSIVNGYKEWIRTRKN